MRELKVFCKDPGRSGFDTPEEAIRETQGKTREARIGEMIVGVGWNESLLSIELASGRVLEVMPDERGYPRLWEGKRGLGKQGEVRVLLSFVDAEPAPEQVIWDIERDRDLLLGRLLERVLDTPSGVVLLLDQGVELPVWTGRLASGGYLVYWPLAIENRGS